MKDKENLQLELEANQWKLKTLEKVHNGSREIQMQIEDVKSQIEEVTQYINNEHPKRD